MGKIHYKFGIKSDMIGGMIFWQMVSFEFSNGKLHKTETHFVPLSENKKKLSMSVKGYGGVTCMS